MADHLNEPHGGVLVDLLVDDDRATDLKKASVDFPSFTLSERHLGDLELLMNGAFSPLRSFMGEGDYDSVVRDMRLGDGTLFPIPIILDVDPDTAEAAQRAGVLALRDPEGLMLAVVHIEEAWEPDREAEAEAVLGTTNQEHPGVGYLRRRTNEFYISGALEGIQLPIHYDFRRLRLTPAELRQEFARMGWTRLVAFQTRNPMHRAHVELTLRAARETEASLLIHPVVGMTRRGDVDHYTRVRAYQAVLSRYPRNTAYLALLPLAMRLAGPREVLWHAIIRKNHGATHFIVGRDHAGPGSDSVGNPFYGPYDAQEALRTHEEELGVAMVPFRQMVYVEDLDDYLPEDDVPADSRILSISGTELRHRLSEGREIPTWFTFPEVTDELRRTHPPRHQQGFTVFFTGLSGSGKSTIANAFFSKLLEIGGRPVTLLDGDIVRTHLSSELGFSKEHRDINIRRIGFVASEITKNRGIAICAPIAPYAETRRWVRELIEPLGGFILVHVATPLEVCEQRDRKGLYAKARAGLIPEFTGISDPYEEPESPELRIDTTDISPGEAANLIILHLESQGYVGGGTRGG